MYSYFMKLKSLCAQYFTNLKGLCTQYFTNLKGTTLYCRLLLLAIDNYQSTSIEKFCSCNGVGVIKMGFPLEPPCRKIAHNTTSMAKTGFNSRPGANAPSCQLNPLMLSHSWQSLHISVIVFAILSLWWH